MHIIRGILINMQQIFGPVPKKLENGFIQNKLCKVQIIKK